MMENKLITAARASLSKKLISNTPNSVCVGFSGGLDSSVALHVMLRLSKEMGFELEAVHVNHGTFMNPEADEWEAFCRSECLKTNIPLTVIRKDVAGKKGRGLEDEARRVRYDAFHAVKSDIVVLGHHADDQVETVLFRMSRGAGVKGLSGMGVERRLSQESGKVVLRPFLDVRKSDFAKFARLEDIGFMEDPSNENVRFSRNALRKKIIPALELFFPSFVENTVKMSSLMSDAESILSEVAEGDIVSCSDEKGKVSVSGLAALSRPRLNNALRLLLDRNGIPSPSSSHIEDLSFCAQKGSGAVTIGGVVLRVWKDGLMVEHNRDLEQSVVWSKGLGLPENCEIGFRKMTNEDSRAWKGVQLGELARTCGVPPWERESLPVIMIGEVPVWGFGVGFLNKEILSESGRVPYFAASAFLSLEGLSKVGNAATSFQTARAASPRP